MSTSLEATQPETHPDPGKAGTASAANNWGMACAAVLILLFVYLAVRSIPTRIELDGPIMLYMGFLMDRFHAVPYRDWFDMNLPGSYFIFFLLGKITGYSDLALRIVDLILSAGTMLTTWFATRRFGMYVALCSSALFGIMYVGGGPEVSMQREFFIVILISVIVAFMSGWRSTKVVPLGITVSLLIGFSATIKPQMLFLWPVAMYFLVRSLRTGSLLPRHTLWLIAASLLGLLIPIALVIGYLWSESALRAFADVSRNYWPLYGAMDGFHRPLAGTARIWHLIQGYFGFCHLRLWIALAAAGVLIRNALVRNSAANKDSPPTNVEERSAGIVLIEDSRNYLLGQSELLALYVALAVFFSIYPVFSGQFWGYHGLPLLYFTIILSSLCFVEVPQVRRVRLRRLLVLRTAAAIALVLMGVIVAIRYNPSNSADVARADDIAAFLKTHLKPGDVVQPLDWTSGAVHGMLIARARIATPFIYDFHFYHHVSQPYIHDLRKRFIAELQQAKPRFIIEITKRRHWPIGNDTTRAFPELRRIVIEDYTPVKRGDGYVISERMARL